MLLFKGNIERLVNGSKIRNPMDMNDLEQEILCLDKPSTQIISRDNFIRPGLPNLT